MEPNEDDNINERYYSILATLPFDKIESRKKAQEELERMLSYAKKNVERGYFPVTSLKLEDLISSITEDRIDFNTLVPDLVEGCYLLDRLVIEGNNIRIEPIIDLKSKSIIDASKVKKADVINALKEAYLPYLINAQILLYGAKERAEQLGIDITDRIREIEGIAYRLFSEESFRFTQKTAILKRIRSNAYLGERGLEIARAMAQKYAAELKLK